MSDDIHIPAFPGSAARTSNNNDEGMLDSSLDIDLGDGSNGEVRRAIAGLEGDWEHGSLHARVNWSDSSTFDDEDDWNNSILLEDE